MAANDGALLQGTPRLQQKLISAVSGELDALRRCAK